MASESRDDLGVREFQKLIEDVYGSKDRARGLAAL
jgi:hypothetical protein